MKTVKLSTREIVKISFLSAMGFLLTYVDIPLPIFPSFLDLEISNVPALVGSLAMSPVVGVFIELIKNLLGLVIKPVGLGVGQLANFVVGCALIIPLSYIYHKNRTTVWYAIGSAVGVVSMVLVASVLNYFIFIPAFSKVLGVPIDTFVGITKEVNPLVTDFRTLIIFAIAPFNFIKGLLVVITSYLTYRLLKPILNL